MNQLTCKYTFGDYLEHVFNCFRGTVISITFTDANLPQYELLPICNCESGWVDTRNIQERFLRKVKIKGTTSIPLKDRNLPTHLMSDEVEIDGVKHPFDFVKEGEENTDED